MQKLTLLLLLSFGSVQVAESGNRIDGLKKGKVPKHHSLSLNEKLIKQQLKIEAEKEAFHLKKEKEALKLFNSLLEEFKKIFKKSDLCLISNPWEENVEHLVTFDSLRYLPLAKSKNTLKVSLQEWFKNLIVLTNKFYATELSTTWDLLSKEAQKELLLSMEETKNKKIPFLSLQDIFFVLVNTTSNNSEIAQQIINFIHKCSINTDQDKENYNFSSFDEDTSLVTSRLVYALLQSCENFDVSKVEELIALPQLFINLFEHQKAILSLLEPKALKSFKLLSYNPVIKKLNLSGNQINLSKFAIPTIFNKINVLNLASCHLNKLPNNFLTFFSQLDDLDLSNNNLKTLGKISKQLDPLTKKVTPRKLYLRKLDLNNNKFENIPQILTYPDIQWPSLTTVNLKKNKIATVNEALFQIPSLLDLDLSRNLIETIEINKDKAPSQRIKLFSLNLSDNKLTGNELFNIFRSIYSIELLNLKNLDHKYADILFKKFIQYCKKYIHISSIKWGEFSHTECDESCTENNEICTKSLERAWKIYGNKLTRHIRQMEFSESTDPFLKTYNLKQLNSCCFPFNKNNFSNQIMKSDLKTIIIQNVPLNSTQLNIITTQLSLLTDLILKNCNLTTDTVNNTSLKLLKYLTTVNFSNNKLEGTVRIKIPKKLLYLILKGNEIEDLKIQIYKNITQSKTLYTPPVLNSSELRTIDLSNNQITSLDDSVTQLLTKKRFPHLKKIDVTNNLIKKNVLKKLQESTTESNPDFVIICDNEKDKNQLLLSDNGHFFPSNSIEKIKIMSELPVIVAQNQQKKKKIKEESNREQSNHSSKTSSPLEESR